MPRSFPLWAAALIFFISFNAPSSCAQDLDSMMHVYAKQLAPEKIHIHFDKTIYNKGETAWYKIYILQRGDSASKNVYLDWYDSDGKLISQTVSPLMLSSSQGSFDIPSDYKGTSIHVKAFTRWMLNDDPAFHYGKELFVNTADSRTVAPPPNKTIVETFAEGGLLIQGLKTRVAFKATNQYGNPVVIKGVLTDANNSILDSIRAQHDGMGSFYLTPQAGHSYSIKWTDENGFIGSSPVTVTKTKGANISVETSAGKAVFRVERNTDAPDKFRRMMLVVHMNQTGLYQASINMTDKAIVSGEIPTIALSSGLLQFTLFNSDGIPVAERVVFINNGLHEFDVKVSAPRIDLTKRGKNTIEISIPDTLFTNMSLSITDAELNAPDQHSIFSDLLLSSELRGKIHNPAYYFANHPDSVAADVDLVMLTHGWRKFNWDKVMAGIPPDINFPLENEYMKISGRVLGMKKKDASTTILNLVVSGKDSSKQMLFVPLEEDGSFNHPITFFDTAKIFYNFSNNASLTYRARIHLENGLLKPPALNLKNIISQPGTGGINTQQLNSLLKQEEEWKKRMDAITLKEVKVTTKLKTRHEILKEKYVSSIFGNNNARRTYSFDLTDPDKPVHELGILHFLQNRVPGLEVNCYSLLNCSISWSRGETPDFYIDETNATLDMVLALAVSQIALVQVIGPPFMYSSTGMLRGAVSLYTKRMEDYEQRRTKGLPSMMLPGYTAFKEFYSPSYEVANEDHIKPDNRTTLYWNPYVITNKAEQDVRIDFFNNDFTKKIRVVLEGINGAGKMMRVEQTIDTAD